MSTWKKGPGEGLITIPLTLTHDMFCMLLWLAEQHNINMNDELVMRIAESFDEDDLEKNPHMHWVQ